MQEHRKWFALTNHVGIKRAFLLMLKSTLLIANQIRNSFVIALINSEIIFLSTGPA